MIPPFASSDEDAMMLIVAPHSLLNYLLIFSLSTTEPISKAGTGSLSWWLELHHRMRFQKVADRGKPVSFDTVFNIFQTIHDLVRLKTIFYSSCSVIPYTN